MAQGRGFQEFLPFYRCRQRWSDRQQEVDFPLFPGYLFCRMNPQNRLPLLTIPGVVHIVGIGKTPVPVDDGEILAIQAAVQSGLTAEPWPFLQVGDRVRVETGPLTGLEGILVRADKQHRIVLSVTLLRRSVAVTIERDCVRPLDNAGRDVPVEFRSLLFPHSPVPAVS
jgi:transcription antitermination factor NusG